jgi:methyl-accepting chemotaxis protein
MALSDLSLKWKLLIPILLLSFLGTTALVLVAHRSQQVLVAKGEYSLLEGHYRQFQQSLESMRMQASVLAWAVAKDPYVGELLASADREGLLHHLSPLYETLHPRIGVTQIHFHKPAGVSFLRVHSPERYGDLLTESRKKSWRFMKAAKRLADWSKGPRATA